MAHPIALAPRDADSIPRVPLNIRRAAVPSVRQRRQPSYPRAPMSNVRPVDAATQARVLADFFTRGHVANVPAVEAETLRQAVAGRTPDVPARSGEGDR